MNFQSEESRGPLRSGAPAHGYDTAEAVRALARPRFTGSDSAAEVRADVRGRLEAMGYEVQGLPFQFSSWPGRFGLSAAGGLMLLGVVAGTALLLLGIPLTALVVLLLAGALVAGVAYAAPRTIDRLPWGRLDGENLLATPPGERPRWLVVAHLDSKSQLLPLSLRTIGPVVGVIGWLALVILAALGAAGLALPAWLPWVAGAAGALGALLALLSWAADDSPGALDNASGVAALLAVAAREQKAGDVAFLVTDAEELGLVRAGHAAPLLPRVAGAINLDGLDDRGTLYVVERFGWPPRGLASHLAAAVMRAATEVDEPVRRKDLPLGMFLDHVALSRAGIPSLSLLRGERGSLGRVHRPADGLDRLDGSGAGTVARVVSDALDHLRARESELKF